MTNSRDVDITVCGAGPVGLAFAALLVRRGVAAERIAVLDAKAATPTAAQPTQNSDPRTIALSYGSSQILQDIGAWPIAASPIKEIHVSRRGYFGRSLIDCKEYDLPALGYVTRYTTLVETLHQVCAEHGLKVEQPVTVTASEEREHHSQLLLSTGELLGCRASR